VRPFLLPVTAFLGQFSARTFVLWAVRCAGLALAYYLTGRLGLLLAIPPGFATAVWPPAGIAFAGLLQLGVATWPGVWFGSFLVNFGLAFDPATPWSSLLLVSAIATGSTLQALAGVALIRRFIGYPNPLIHVRDIAIFMMLGPVPCAMAPTIGITALWWSGRIAASEISFNWFNWWVGDAMGVLTLAALLLVWTPREEQRTSHRRWLVTLPVLFAAGLVVALFVYSSQRELTRITHEFEEGAATAGASLEHRMRYSVDALFAMRTVYHHARDLNQHEFTEAAADLLSRRPEIEALTWNPRTPPSHYPVAWVAPLLAENEQVIGLDPMKDPIRQAAMQKACETGQMAATPGVRLAQDARWIGTIVFLPVASNTFAMGRDCHDYLEGMLVAVYRVDHLVESVLSRSAFVDYQYQLFDSEAGGAAATAASGSIGSNLLYDSASTRTPLRDVATAANGAPPSYTAMLTIADRQWILRVLPTPHFLATRRSLQAWSVLAGGLLFTSTLTCILLIVTGRNVIIERVIKEQTASALALSESQNRALFEQSAAGIIEIHPSGHILRANQRFCQLVGRSLAELTTRKLAEITHPDDLEFDRLHYEQAMNNTLPKGGWTKRYVRPDGSAVWVRVAGSVVRNQAGEPMYLVGVVQDIRDLMDAAQALKESRLRFESLLESAPDGMVIVDKDGKIVLVNAQTERLFGYQRSELLGQSIEMLVPERYRHVHAFNRVGFFIDPRARRMGAGHDLYARHKNGSEFPVEISLSPLQTESGLLVSSAIRDVSERKRSEALIRGSLEEKEILLREIHHRVKNNLAVVASLFYLQATTTEDADVRQTFEESRNRILSMALVHEQLYRSSRLAAVDFAEYASSLAQQLLRSYQRPDQPVGLTTSLSPLELSVDVAIPCGLVLNELLTNCLKHAFNGSHSSNGFTPHIEIALTPVVDGTTYELRVSDNGIGMSGIDIDATQSLGLRLIRSLTKQLDGKVAFEPLPRGTRVRLTFEV
jgi:PAS domain S-box-containing protein